MPTEHVRLFSHINIIQRIHMYVNDNKSKKKEDILKQKYDT